MNTATCHICKRPDVTLDDSGRLTQHRMYPLKSINNPMCEGSGSLPQAPDGAEKDKVRRLYFAPYNCLGEESVTDSDLETVLYSDHVKVLSDLATLNAQAREKIAGLESALAMTEDAAEKGNKARELAGAMEACIKEQDEKIAGLEKERERLDWFVANPTLLGYCCEGGGWSMDEQHFDYDLRSALDAARDKKG